MQTSNDSNGFELASAGTLRQKSVPEWRDYNRLLTAEYESTMIENGSLRAERDAWKKKAERLEQDVRELERLLQEAEPNPTASGARSSGDVRKANAKVPELGPALTDAQETNSRVKSERDGAFEELHETRTEIQDLYTPSNQAGVNQEYTGDQGSSKLFKSEAEDDQADDEYSAAPPAPVYDEALSPSHYMVDPLGGSGLEWPSECSADDDELSSRRGRQPEPRSRNQRTERSAFALPEQSSSAVSKENTPKGTGLKAGLRDMGLGTSRVERQSSGATNTFQPGFLNSASKSPTSTVPELDSFFQSLENPPMAVGFGIGFPRMGLSTSSMDRQASGPMNEPGPGFLNSALKALTSTVPEADSAFGAFKAASKDTGLGVRLQGTRNDSLLSSGSPARPQSTQPEVRLPGKSDCQTVAVGNTAGSSALARSAAIRVALQTHGSASRVGAPKRKASQADIGPESDSDPKVSSPLQVSCSPRDIERNFRASALFKKHKPQ
ncbi:MAG: hypothetical protein Q9226_004826 [Calogaya cf. arnoldii]